MIVAERELIAIFNTLPVITINEVDYKPFYDFGGHEYLLKFLNDKEKEEVEPYPLIWLETPVTLYGKNRLRGDLKLIIATSTDKNISNRVRLESTFKNILEPTYENVVKALKQSGKTRLLNRDSEQYTTYYDYGFNKESEVTEVWDAIKFECEVEFYNGCLKTINY